MSESAQPRAHAHAHACHCHCFLFWCGFPPPTLSLSHARSLSNFTYSTEMNMCNARHCVANFILLNTENTITQSSRGMWCGMACGLMMVLHFLYHNHFANEAYIDQHFCQYKISECANLCVHARARDSTRFPQIRLCLYVFVYACESIYRHRHRLSN